MSGSPPPDKGRIPRQLVRALTRFYYPRIEVSQGENIPSHGPVLLVANHPNALLDPPLLGIAAQRPIHFLAKAPLFRIPVFGRIIQSLGMLPAYRACDDPTQMKRNVSSLAEAARCLGEGRAVGIFPEGKSHDLPKVDQVKSGAARIALQAYEQGQRDLIVVPIGLNHQRKQQFRTAVWIQIGRPLKLTDWLQSAPSEDKARVRALTQEIDRRLKSVTIHLDKEAWTPFLNELEHLYPIHQLASQPPSIAALRQRKRIAEAMNYFLRKDPERAASLADAVGRYFATVKSHGLTVDSPVLRSAGPRLIGLLLARTHWLVLGFALTLPGTLFHIIPFAIARGLAHLMQTNVRATYALARLASSVPVYLLWYSLAAWILLNNFPPAWLGLLLGLMPIMGGLALRYWYYAGRTFCPLLHEWRILLRPAQVRALKQQRDALPLQALAEEFDASGD